MKILISYLFCTKGGVETALLNRLKTVDQNKHQIDLHFFSDYGGISLFENQKERVYVEGNPRQLCSLIKEQQYDMVIAIDSPDTLKALEVMNYSGKRGLEVHTTYEDGLKYLKNLDPSNVDFVIVPSMYQKELIEHILPNKTIYVLGNAIEDCFNYNRNAIWHHPQKLILWVGRIDPHKNWRGFLQIANEIHKADANTYFWLIGGLKSDPTEIGAMEKMIYRLDMEGCVRWIPQKNYSDMGNMYSMVANSGGMYISTSQNESFGMTVIEAMKCRCPVVVNSVGGMCELTKEGRGLCLDDISSPRQIAKIINFLEQNNKQEMIELAYKYVMDNYTCRKIGKRFEHILDASLAGNQQCDIK